MKDLHEYLTRQRDWLAGMAGRKHANVALSLSDLTTILKALEPHKRGPMEPPRMKLSPEDAARMYAAIQAGSNEEWVAILRAEA